jgi:serine/threonine protein kinase
LRKNSVAREFSYKKLSAATNNFSEKQQLGKGTFGEVYRGDLPGQLKVAVKKLTPQLPRTRKDYANEIKILGSKKKKTRSRSWVSCITGTW